MFIFNALSNFKLVQRFENRSNLRGLTGPGEWWLHKRESCGL